MAGKRISRADMTLELRKLANERDEARRELARKRRAYAKLRRQGEETAGFVVKLAGQLAEARLELDRSARRLGEAETTAERSQRERDEARAETEELRDQLAACAEARVRAQAAIGKLTTERDELLSPLRGLSRELARGSPTEGDCQSPPAHTLGAGGGR